MTVDADLFKLQEQLRLCQRELAHVRHQQEQLVEASTGSSEHDARFDELSANLDRRLSQGEAVTGRRGWLKRRILSTMPRSDEDRALSILRSSPLMDGAWYFRQYPEVASTGLSAALHYLRHGAGQGKDPGPDFATADYLAHHPEVGTDVNPLVHSLDSTASSVR